MAGPYEGGEGWDDDVHPLRRPRRVLPPPYRLRVTQAAHQSPATKNKLTSSTTALENAVFMRVPCASVDSKGPNRSQLSPPRPARATSGSACRCGVRTSRV